SFPNPFLRARGLSGTTTPAGVGWNDDLILEVLGDDGQPKYPHVTMTMLHNYNGHENSMLYGELAPLISAMRSRANQPLVTDEEEMEKLYDEKRDVFPEKQRVFPMEKRFPVLMLSFLGPQHARIFYACLDGKNLIIRQSKLYSFESKADAPVELFARFLLSTPRDERVRG
ncbi:hypothetical protein P170DRAFT_350521, partial [Aspergillus steynii IBT 23096]